MKNKINLRLSLSPKVLQHISSNVYRNSASGFKELASNSFDANATEFKITMNIGIKNNKHYIDSIEAFDNGEGMDLEELKFIFGNIGNSSKALNLDYDSMDKFDDKTKRPKIGRIGIGLFSIASACNSFIIETKKKSNNPERATVTLPDFIHLRTTNFSLENFNAGNATIEELDNESNIGAESYTKITIKEFTRPFMDEVLENFNSSISYKMLRYKIDNKFEDFLNNITKNRNIEDASGIDRFIFNLSSMLPIEYLPDGPFRKCVVVKNPEILDKIKQRLENYNFKSYIEIKLLNGSITTNSMKLQLFRNVLLPLNRDAEDYPASLHPIAEVYEKVDEITNEIGENVKLTIRFYIYRQNLRIRTTDYRGILYRIFDVGIGDYQYQKFRYFGSRAFNFQTSMEVFLDNGFQSAVNIDRESLYEASYSYRYLKAYLDYIMKGITPDKDNDEVEDNGNTKQQKPINETSIARDETEQLTENKNIEKTFSEQLKNAFSEINEEPIMTRLNKLVNPQKVEEYKGAIEERDPLYYIAMEKNQGMKKFKTLKLELTDFNKEPDISYDNSTMIIRIPVKGNKVTRLPYDEVMAGAKIVLDGNMERQFIKFLKNLYEYYK